MDHDTRELMSCCRRSDEAECLEEADCNLELSAKRSRLEWEIVVGMSLTKIREV